MHSWATLLGIGLAVSSALAAYAQEPAFETRIVNPAAEYPACAVFDVNHDGQVDIVSGGFWYEAPQWTKHFLREVEVIRGRFDDYSNLEYDVNADGWSDLISVNYRSKSLFWIEHPGEKIKTDPESPWTKHVIDTPGPMETGRLYDIDGDGRLDILPNGTDFAAWYSVEPGSQPKFEKYDLPQEIAGHGIGFGDVNGDGRGDIVGPRGWLEAPEDRCAGRWLWHPDWELHRDASIPIVVYDVDGDGDNDLVYGRGHRHGLYWLEQTNPTRERGTEDTNPKRERGTDEGATAALPSSAESREGATAGLPSSAESKEGATAGLPSSADSREGATAGLPSSAESREGATAGLPSSAKSKEGATAGLPSSAWTRHAIDTTWSQFHSLLLADLDSDGRKEIVAGKRYLGHEGKDPGEWDPIVSFSYRFDKSSATFVRRYIKGLCPGFGLDPKVADVDGNGRDDIVVADRNGLAILMQFTRRGATGLGSFGPGGEGEQPRRFDRMQPLADRFDGQPVRTPADWSRKRMQIASAMEQVMGPLPDPSRRVPLDVQIESRDETPDYVRIKLTYAAEPGDRVPALLLVPHAAENAGPAGKKLPAMLCLHPTNVDGKAQTAALVGPATRHYGHQLAQRGFICLIPDYPSFGDYKDYDFQQKKPGTDEPLYVSGTMKAVWNNIRAVDLLESLGYVDADNIGAIGHSLGGHNGLFTAVFEPRLKCVVTSCGFTAFHDYYKGDLKGWTSDRYMPRIRDVYESNPDKVPFDFPEILAAIAPRSVYVAAPMMDHNFDVGGVRKCIAAAQPVYDLLGGAGNLAVEYPECGHDFPDDVRERVYAWLEKQLK